MDRRAEASLIGGMGSSIEIAGYCSMEIAEGQNLGSCWVLEQSKAFAFEHRVAVGSFQSRPQKT